MATPDVKQKTIKPIKKWQKVLVEIPQNDAVFFQLFAGKMGWSIVSQQTLWDKYINNHPQNIALTEDEMMEELRAVRYGKV